MVTYSAYRSRVAGRGWQSSSFYDDGPRSKDGGGGSTGRGSGRTSLPPSSGREPPGRGSRGDAVLRAIASQVLKRGLSTYGRLAYQLYKLDPVVTRQFAGQLNDVLDPYLSGQSMYSALSKAVYFTAPANGTYMWPSTDWAANSGLTLCCDNGYTADGYALYTGGNCGTLLCGIGFQVIHGRRVDVTVRPGHHVLLLSAGNAIRGTVQFQYANPGLNPVTVPYYPAGTKIPRKRGKTVPLPQALKPPPSEYWYPDNGYRFDDDLPQRLAKVPYAVPAVEYSIGTGGATGGVPVDHVLLPPRPRGKKEKKIVFPGNHPLMRLYGGVTEISDFVDAIAKALPGQPCKGLPLHQKALCVYRHAPDYRKPGVLRDAVYNVLLNEAQDRAVGAFGKQLGKNVARLYRQGYYPNRPFGLSHGGFSWRHH